MKVMWWLKGSVPGGRGHLLPCLPGEEQRSGVRQEVDFLAERGEQTGHTVCSSSMSEAAVGPGGRRPLPVLHRLFLSSIQKLLLYFPSDSEITRKV